MYGLDAIDRQVERLLSDLDYWRADVDALEVAARLQIPLLWDKGQTARGRFQCVGGQPTIFLRDDERPERLQWAAAHEIGEAIAGQMARSDEEHDWGSPTTRERFANDFARRLLLPREWFVEACREEANDLRRLKQRFPHASHELIALRWLDVSARLVIAVYDQGECLRRRSNLPIPGLALAGSLGGRSRSRRSTTSSQACQQVLTPLEQTLRQRLEPHRDRAVLRRDDWTGQAWALDEPGWRREIVRLEWTGDDDHDF